MTHGPDFVTQVNSLTSLSASGTDEISQFLTDGATDIINRAIAIKPENSDLFTKESSSAFREASCGTTDTSPTITLADTSSLADGMYVVGDGIEPNSIIISIIEDTSFTLDKDCTATATVELTFWNDFVDINNAEVIEASLGYGGDNWEDYLETTWGEDVEWVGTEYPCTKMTANNAYRAKDSTNLEYRSRFNPAYYIKNGKVFSVPDADSDMNLRVTHINYPQVEHDDAAISYFPKKMIYLVPMYAAIKLLNATLAEKTMPAAPIKPALTPPNTPSLSGNSVSFSQTAPSYLEPVLNLDPVPTIDDLVISSTVPIAPNLVAVTIDDSALIPPTYTPPAMGSMDYVDVTNWINTEEDSEMSSARVQELQVRIAEYSARLQESQAAFTKEATSFQADLGTITQNAQLQSTSDGQKLQKYGVEIQTYTAEVTTAVQEYTQNLQKEIQLWQVGRQTDLSKYSSDIQNATGKFTEETTEYQALLQIAIQDAQLTSTDDSLALQKYQTEVASYQAELQKYTAEVQDYTTQVGSKSAEYQWLVEQYTRLKVEYDTAFAMLNPQMATQAGRQRA